MDLVKTGLPKSQSILDVGLKAKQTFNKEIEKIDVPFDREEDMILLCLSIFLQDFIHDYNLASMHKRIFKGEVDSGELDENGKKIKIKTYDLLLKLNLGIVDPTYKMFCYEVGGFGEVSLYDDNQFEDSSLSSKTNGFLTYNRQFEESLPAGYGGESYHAHRQSVKRQKRPSVIPKRLYTAKNRLMKAVGLNQNKKIRNVKTISNAALDLQNSVDSDLMQTAIHHFETNADFLSFHSGLNSFIVSYLGYGEDDVESPEFIELYKKIKEPLTQEIVNNAAMYNSILCSLDQIIIDFRKFRESSVEYSFFEDIFLVLKRALIDTFENTNSDFKEDPLAVLNSPNMLRQFTRYYLLFLNSESIGAFYGRLEKIGGLPIETPLGRFPEQGTVLPSLLLPPAKEEGEEESIPNFERKARVNVAATESTVRVHNNLITTLTRGMFIKLGIWKHFFPDESSFIFSKETVDNITYDKLTEIYPVEISKGGHINNELLIMQILILKHMLLEMPPSRTLTFGSKIDDHLKNYLDVFYNSYFLKKQFVERPEIVIDPEVSENPDVSLLEDDSSIFNNGALEEDEDDKDSVSGDFMDGGENPDEVWGDVELTGVSHIYPEKLEPVQHNEKPESIYTFPTEVTDVEINVDEEIIKLPRAPRKPILLKNLKKIYQNNIYTIQNLKESKIPSITYKNIVINNLYDLLNYNTTLIHKKNSSYNITAPFMKFVVNNAANIAANLNGANVVYSKKDKDDVTAIVDEINDAIRENLVKEKLLELEDKLESIMSKLSSIESQEREISGIKRRGKPLSIRKYNKMLQLQYDIKLIKNTELIPCENRLYLLNTYSRMQSKNPETANAWLAEWTSDHKKWLNDCQAIFGLYRNLVRGTFCPTVSMMDAMFNCSIKYGATETKEVGTSNYELFYQKLDDDGNIIKKISYGGTVLNYRETVNGMPQLNAKIDFDLVCIDKDNTDIANISTLGMQVAESHDLKASVVYKCVVDRIREIYIESNHVRPEDETPELAGINVSNPEERKMFLQGKIHKMWSNMQFYVNKENFNKLLGATAIKTFGDYLQECLACIKWGGYVNSMNQFSDKLKDFIRENNITPIYRSVSEANKIIPYDEDGNALRLGVQGDRPSGFRSIYILLNGSDGINQQAISGYVFTSASQTPSRTILVSRNSYDSTNDNSNINDDAEGVAINGKVVYITRELIVDKKQKEDYLKSLQFKKTIEKKTFIDPTTGEKFEPEITEPGIEGSVQDIAYKAAKITIPKILKPNYDNWTDYETEPVDLFLNSKPPMLADYGTSGAESGEDGDIGKEKVSRKKKSPQKNPIKSPSSGEDLSTAVKGGDLKRTHYKRLKQNKKTKRKRV